MNISGAQTCLVLNRHLDKLGVQSLPYLAPATNRLLYNYQLSTRPNLKIDNKLKTLEE